MDLFGGLSDDVATWISDQFRLAGARESGGTLALILLLVGAVLALGWVRSRYTALKPKVVKAWRHAEKNPEYGFAEGVDSNGDITVRLIATRWPVDDVALLGLRHILDRLNAHPELLRELSALYDADLGIHPTGHPLRRSRTRRGISLAFGYCRPVPELSSSSDDETVPEQVTAPHALNTFERGGLMLLALLIIALTPLQIVVAIATNVSLGIGLSSILIAHGTWLTAARFSRPMLPWLAIRPSFTLLSGFAGTWLYDVGAFPSGAPTGWYENQIEAVRMVAYAGLFFAVGASVVALGASGLSSLRPSHQLNNVAFKTVRIGSMLAIFLGALASCGAAYNAARVGGGWTAVLIAALDITLALSLVSALWLLVRGSRHRSRVSAKK